MRKITLNDDFYLLGEEYNRWPCLIDSATNQELIVFVRRTGGPWVATREHPDCHVPPEEIIELALFLLEGTKNDSY